MPADQTGVVHQRAMLPWHPVSPEFWVRHHRSGRWGIVRGVTDLGEWYLLYFPDLDETQWRRATAFERAGNKRPPPADD